MRAARRAVPTLLITFAACAGADAPDPPGPGPSGPVTPDELARGGDCPAPSGAGTPHAGFIEADETWTAAASPHLLTAHVRITATVTVEPCARVVFDPGVRLDVGTDTADGRLIARGEVVGTGDGREVRAITFGARTAGTRWGQLAVASRGRVDLSVVALLDGGDAATFTEATLFARGVAGGTNDGEVTRSVAVDRVLIERSGGHGVDLDGWAAFTEGSTALWIRGSGSDANADAVRIEAGVVSTLPTELSLTGNRRDAIAVRTSKAFLRDDRFVARGAPYRIEDTLYVAPGAAGAPVTLSAEPGVRLAFLPGTGVVVGSTADRLGVLELVGTAAQPVVLLSAADAPAAGDWSGLVFRYTPVLANSVAHAEVRHAGGESGANGFGCGPGDNDAAVIIYGQGPDDSPPGEVFIRDTLFDEIGGSTVIVSGWVDDAGPNFSEGNAFGAATPPCKVSRPQRSGAGDVCDGGRRDSCWP